MDLEYINVRFTYLLQCIKDFIYSYKLLHIIRLQNEMLILIQAKHFCFSL